jgi:hypothetical protein
MLTTFQRHSLLAFQLTLLLDKGCSMPVDETLQRIRDGSLFYRLEEQYRGEPYELDLSSYDAGERRTILKVFDVMDVGGVEHNGLALCLVYCIEVMRNPDGFGDDRFYEE